MFLPHWYKGRVEKVRDDGKYDIAYDDGDHESGVLPKYVKPLQKQGKPARTATAAGDPPGRAPQAPPAAASATSSSKGATPRMIEEI